jgi:hypothetical protein
VVKKHKKQLYFKKTFQLKYFLLLFLVLTGWISGAQNPVEFSLKNSTLAATDSLLPFWFSANQQGKIKPAGSFLNVSDLFIGQDYAARTDSAIAFTWGGNLVATFGETSYYQLNILSFGYEFTDTRQQSIQDSIYRWNETTEQWGRLENENYFNHGFCNSGYTYHRQVMGSPLFFPVAVREGIARGVRSNRFFAHHLGISGYFAQHLRWRGMITYIEHWGTYGNPYNPKQKQVSGLIECFYTNSRFPVDLGLSVGADKGNTINNNLGMQN